MLGVAPVATQARHALGFVEWLPTGARCLDLGSGGGLPGLVIAEVRPDVALTLLDARGGRTDQLIRLVGRLGIGHRVTVVQALAAEAARLPQLAGSFDAVVARSFGPPRAVLEAAAPFLTPGGRVVVSEPPDRSDRSDRWPETLLRRFGARRLDDEGGPVACFVLEQHGSRSPRFT